MCVVVCIYFFCFFIFFFFFFDFCADCYRSALIKICLVCFILIHVLGLFQASDSKPRISVSKTLATGSHRGTTTTATTTSTSTRNVTSTMTANNRLTAKENSSTMHATQTTQPRTRRPKIHAPKCSFQLERPMFDMTIVMVTRVDQYGGEESFERMQNVFDFLDFNLRSVVKVALELIIVEYNAIPGAARLSDVVSFPEFVHSLRVIQVPSKIHKAFCAKHQVSEASVVPVLEFVAKNIGIRRARGKFVLPMAMDTILSSDWWKFVANDGLSKLDETKLYRMFRADLGQRLPKGMNLRLVEKELPNWVYKIWGTTHGDEFHIFEGDLKKALDAKFMSKAADQFRKGLAPLQEACGDFQLMHRELWFKLRGYMEATTYGHYDTILGFVADFEGVTGEVFEYPLVLFHQVLVLLVCLMFSFFSRLLKFHKSGGFAKRVGNFQETNWGIFVDQENSNKVCLSGSVRGLSNIFFFFFFFFFFFKGCYVESK